MLTAKASISIKTLPAEIAHPSPSVFIQSNGTASEIKKEPGLKDAAAKAEYETIMKVLKEVNNNKSKAAGLLNIDRKTLYNKIRMYEESLQG